MNATNTVDGRDHLGRFAHTYDRCACGPCSHDRAMRQTPDELTKEAWRLSTSDESTFEETARAHEYAAEAHLEASKAASNRCASDAHYLKSRTHTNEARMIRATMAAGR